MKSLPEQIKSFFAPEEITKPGMVYEVWSDGEITLTKSGDLYRMRGLHCVMMAAVPEHFGKLWAHDFPTEPNSTGFASIPVKSKEDAFAVREIIFNNFIESEKLRNRK